MSESGSGTSWLKYGCLGCVGVVVIVVMLVGSIAGMAAMKAKSEEVAKDSFHPEIPMADPQTRTAEEAGDATTAVADRSTGRVILDLSGAEFEVRPARSGESLHVDASYDRKSYSLTESLDTDDPSNWTYEVRFERTSSGMMAALKQVFGGSHPKATIFLPRDVPIALELSISEGGAEVDLGGLWLTTIDARFDKGGMQFEVSSPTRVPVEQMTIHGAMGGIALGRLGNASPRRLDIDLSMGGMDIDLRGQWLNDADVVVGHSMGGASMQLPHGVRIEGLEGHSTVSAPAGEVAVPTLRFDVSGEIQIR